MLRAPFKQAHLLAVALAFVSAGSHAQCDVGQVQVTIQVTTDDYGYETYWQLLPSGNACGTGTLFTGGNPLMECSGGGWQLQQPGGYPDATTIQEGPWCLTEGANYDIFSVDDWGDGQAAFEVFVNGVSVAQFQSPGPTNIFTFTAQSPMARDMAVTALTTPLYAFTDAPITVTGMVKSFGADTVHSFDLTYTIDGGAPVTSTINGVQLVAGNAYEFVHPTPWTPGSTGTYGLTVRVTAINGGDDQNTTNDERSSTHTISPAIPDRMAEYLAAPPIITQVASSDQDLLVPRDLAFHPDAARNELWVINKDVEESGGSTVTFFHPGEPDQTFQWRRDVNAWHFMSLPTGIAMGDNNCFSTCPGVFDANHNGGDPFTGPTLWSADTAIYARYFGPLGSHLDMLHVDPNSQGIAHERWNRYWVVDGYRGDIVMNDFRTDHGPGNDYHGDAIIRRYADVTITKDPNDHVVSHAVMDKRNGMLYVVDFGGQRVLRIDTRTGAVSGPGLYGPWENYVEYSMVSGYAWSAIITSGLVQPAGIELVGDHLLVSDHANGDIIIYDISGDEAPEVGRIHTGLGGLMGITVGPDGLIWGVNATYHQLLRIDPQQATAIREQAGVHVQCYPCPAADQLTVELPALPQATMEYAMFDPGGRCVRRGHLAGKVSVLPVNDLTDGTYVLEIAGPGRAWTQRFTVLH